jgi:hypothetical protein
MLTVDCPLKEGEVFTIAVIPQHSAAELLRQNSASVACAQ